MRPRAWLSGARPAMSSGATSSEPSGRVSLAASTPPLFIRNRHIMDIRAGTQFVQDSLQLLIRPLKTPYRYGAWLHRRGSAMFPAREKCVWRFRFPCLCCWNPSTTPSRQAAENRPRQSRAKEQARAAYSGEERKRGAASAQKGVLTMPASAFPRYGKRTSWELPVYYESDESETSKIRAREQAPGEYIFIIIFHTIADFFEIRSSTNGVTDRNKKK